MKKKTLLSVLAAAAALGGCALYYLFFTNWTPVVYSLSGVLFAAAAGLIAARFAEKKPVLRALIAGGAYLVFFFGANILINNVIYRATRNTTAAAIFCALNLMFFIVFYCACSRKKPKKRAAAAAVFALASLVTLGTMLPAQLQYFRRTFYKRVASPVAGVRIETPARETVNDADYYVSPQGDDAADGSLQTPFQTLERARDAVRALDKTGRSGVTVAVMAGDYRVESLVFDERDSGTEQCPVTYRAYGDGDAVLNGGFTVPLSAVSKVSDAETLARLSDAAKENVLQADLFSLGITAEQYGKIYAIGGYNQAVKYDGDWVGDLYCELFINDVRQTIARYPNGAEYLYTGEVVKEGEGRESADAKIKGGYDELRNPEPDVYKMDKALSEHIASWKTLDDVWMFGYWRYDWADGSTPVGVVDHENLTVSPMFVSGYGAKKNAPYYFFNVFEELDSPGEWYLDREHGMLYFWPPEGYSENAAVELSLSTACVIDVQANDLTFDGFTVKCTRGDAVRITGDRNTVKNCLIKNVSGNALIMSGYDNLAADNEITRTGKGGVILSGGDRETLKPGGNRAENNLVHDWSEIYETYQPAFTLNGVGNVCAHNEMFNSPHEAITYSGNDHLIEYNLIHDVNLKTDDGGAIYSGRRWDWYGNVIRYNLIYDLGADGHRPQGIYMDDALAGQTIYGNVMVNVPNFGLQLGGGRDLDVHDNLVINSSVPISYDDRALNGLPGHEDSNFYPHYKENGDCWRLLFDSPWESAAWREAYPQYETYSSDFSHPEDRDFVLNPSYSKVTHNVLISAEGKIGGIADTVYLYSEIGENPCFKLSAMKKIFVDPENGDYTVRKDAPLGFRLDVPDMERFGRQ